MDQKITATELARSLSEVLSRVQYRNERFVVQRNGEAVAALIPLTAPEGVMLHDALTALGRLRMPDDDFANDLEEIQENQPPAEFPDWPS
jgi:antitoxin (DNA-binding transcriptional repressor) of toxin-antitoxin stability system